MAQTITITLTTAGLGTGPFNLYSNLDGFYAPFETNVDRYSLISGYPSIQVPNGTSVIRVKSMNATCDNYIDLAITTTTTTTTTTSTTTTTTTATPNRSVTVFASHQSALITTTSVNIYYALNGSLSYTYLGSYNSDSCVEFATINVPDGTTIDYYVAQPSSGGDRPVLFGADLVNDCSVLDYSRTLYCLNTTIYSTVITANTDISLVTAVQEGDLRYC